MVIAIVAVVVVPVMLCLGAAVGRCWYTERRDKARRQHRHESMMAMERQDVLPGTHAIQWVLIIGLASPVASPQREETVLPELPPPTYDKNAPPVYDGKADTLV